MEPLTVRASQLKKIIVSLIPKFFINWIIDAYLGEHHIHFSQEGEDIILENIFARKKIGFYVDIGAHHPTRFSITQKLSLSGWRGINIDANPDCFDAFQEMRKRDINLICGISDVESELTYYKFHEPALNTFSKEKYESLIKETHYKLKETLKISTQRLESVLSKYVPENTEIDLMSIDVEGFEMNVLKSNDWNRFSPNVILLEDVSYQLEDLYKNPCHVFLKEKVTQPLPKPARPFFIAKTKPNSEFSRLRFSLFAYTAARSSSLHNTTAEPDGNIFRKVFFLESKYSNGIHLFHAPMRKVV